MEFAIISKDIETQAFAQRLAKSMGIQVTDEGSFAGMMKYHSGLQLYRPTHGQNTRACKQMPFLTIHDKS